MDLHITKKQKSFIDADAFEILFGGAAGGGKSYGQLVDALIYALKYPKSKQIIFRRTFPDLERSIIRTSLDIYPQDYGTYNNSKHMWSFINGSIIDFGYIDSDKDVYQYQSAEYDVIRFDELTQFTEFMYTYMFSRCRGANPYPRHIKSSTNPGGIGHAWVKARFIDIGKAGETHKIRIGKGKFQTRIFIPSFLSDNKYLVISDPEYEDRLEALPEKERKALKDGNWDIFDGQYFAEFDRKIHVIEPFEIPKEWVRYRAIDYGLDMLACFWIAVDTKGSEYVYKELYEPNLIISDAAKRILEVNGKDEIKYTYAPPDLWNRRNDTGLSAYDVFRKNGVILTRSSNNRIQGWYCVAEHLKIHDVKDEQTGEIKQTSKLKIFDTCVNLIRTLPTIQHDKKNPNDVAKEPHELTHAPDALRAFCIERTKATKIKTPDELEKEEEIARRRKAGILGIAGNKANSSYIHYGG